MLFECIHFLAPLRLSQTCFNLCTCFCGYQIHLYRRCCKYDSVSVWVNIFLPMNVFSHHPFSLSYWYGSKYIDLFFGWWYFQGCQLPGRSSHFIGDLLPTDKFLYVDATLPALRKLTSAPGDKGQLHQGILPNSPTHDDYRHYKRKITILSDLGLYFVEKSGTSYLFMQCI